MDLQDFAVISQANRDRRLEILANPDRIARPLEISGGVAWSRSGIPIDLNRYGDNHVCQF